MADPLLNATEKKSAFNPLKQPKRIGNFKIDKMRLTSSNINIGGDGTTPTFLDLTTSIWHELNLYEDIYSPVVSGDITITDTVGLIESFPIIGEEILDLSFSTEGVAPPSIPVSGGPTNPTPSEAPKNIINRFRVYKLDPPIQVTDTSRTIKLYFVTDSQFTNLLSKVRKTYPTSENIKFTRTVSNDKTYTLADIARDIFYDFFIKDKKPLRQPTTRKPFLVEPTRYKAEIVIPNWNPFKAISFLASKAVSANHDAKGANFVFYQTLQGFRFVSIETLMMGGFRRFTEKDENVVEKEYPHLLGSAILASATARKISHIPIYKDDPEPEGDIKPYVAFYKYMPANMGENRQSSYESVTSFRLVDSFDTMKNVALGMYANRVITHDLIRMKVARKEFHYVTPPSTITVRDVHAPEGPEATMDIPSANDEETQIDESVSTDIGRLCSDNADFLGRPEAHISLVPTNFGQGAILQNGPVKSDGGTIKFTNGRTIKLDIKENHVEDVLARRISQRLQLDSVKITFTSPGDSAREVGDLISFDFPSENPKLAERTGRGAGHKYYSGKYLITALRHKVTQDEYTIHVEAIKDGYASAISSGFGVTDAIIQVANTTTGLTEGEATETAKSLGLGT